MYKSKEFDYDLWTTQEGGTKHYWARVITSKGNKKRSLPTHYYAEYIHGLEVPGIVLLEQIKTIDKRRIQKYMGRMSRQQMDEIGEAIEAALGLYVPEEMEAP